MTQPTDLVKVIRMVPATLILKFQNALDFSNEKDIIIDSRVEFQRIPLHFAVSMFQIPETFAMYKSGYFTFSKEDKEKVFKYAKELQIYFDGEEAASSDQPGVLYTEKQIANFVKLGRAKEIQEILDFGTKPQRELLLATVIENADKITMSLIRLVEDKLGVQISEGDE